MSATDELRRMLDERGVEWEDCGNGSIYVDHGGDAWRFDYDEHFDRLCIHHFCSYTPAQAIEATLGRGTCHDAAIEGEWFECSECGTVKQLIHPHYCPNCGRKVVDE